MSLTREQVLEILKTQCNALMYGSCSTLACLRRGGYTKGLPLEQRLAIVPTCEAQDMANTDAAQRERIAGLEKDLAEAVRRYKTDEEILDSITKEVCANGEKFIEVKEIGKRYADMKTKLATLEREKAALLNRIGRRMP